MLISTFIAYEIATFSALTNWPRVGQEGLQGKLLLCVYLEKLRNGVYEYWRGGRRGSGHGSSAGLGVRVKACQWLMSDNTLRIWRE